LRGTASIESGIGASHPVDHAMQTPGRLRGTDLIRWYWASGCVPWWQPGGDAFTVEPIEGRRVGSEELDELGGGDFEGLGSGFKISEV
jgi:hypothetical protein